MLFYSSAKYPLEDSYMKYLSEHGGHSNAFTSCEHTNFHFDVNVDHLEEALDRFAQFFICPLMSADATSREINAVDSENTKNLTSDAWRLDQLGRHFSSQSHPYHKFGTGSLETLDSCPKQRGIDTREELLKFYDEHYSSNLMNLTVYGQESLDELQALIEHRFDAIKNTQKERPCFSGMPCDPENLQILIKAVPVEDKHTLVLSWIILPELLHYKEAPSQYISHLLGHEADGSLFALLKSLGWATGLCVYECDSSMEYAFFRVIIELTDLGQEHVEEVIGFTFQYIRILEGGGVQEWIFQELQAVREMDFHFSDKKAPMKYVVQLASKMRDYPVEDWLVGSSLPRAFNPDTILRVIKMLTPENVRILSASKQYAGKTTCVEPWYTTSFSMEKISMNTIEQWKSCPIDSRLHLPSANPFLATDLSLKSNNQKMDLPGLLHKSSMSTLWFKSDHLFKTPKACIEIDFHSPESNSTPEATVLTAAFVELVVDYLNEIAYFAEVAGLSYRITSTSHGFQVSMSGYNHKIASLLDKILEKVVNFQVAGDRFSIVKEKLLKQYENCRFWQPYEQVLHFSKLLLHHKKWDMNAFVEAIKIIDAMDLSAFVPRLMSKIYFECYIAGNVDKAEAEKWRLMVEEALVNGNTFKCKPLLGAQHSEKRIINLVAQSNLYYPVAGSNLDDTNSALQFYLQVGQDDEILNVLVELFILSTKQQVFHELRSVQQLGYIVVLANRNDFGVRGAQFIIQSAVKDPKDLEARVEAFLDALGDNLSKLTDEEFKRNVDALIGEKLEKHKNLREETGFFWTEIAYGTLKFSRQKDEVAILKNVRKEDLLEFYASFIKSGGPKRAKLSIRLYGGGHQDQFNSHIQDCQSKAETARGVQEILIKDIYEFKRSQALYRSLK
ncbi:hypothetical protein KP509_17G012900 [Ceratopteris richardii]|nr:hypothetical protein KP509_17G012900 [Ceratopteris richardii]